MNLIDKTIGIIEIVESRKWFKLLARFFFMIGIIATIMSFKGIIYDTDKALEYHQEGSVLFEEGDFEEALVLEEKAYSINRNISGVKYYYALSLIATESPQNYEKARKMLLVNERSLTDNELALYGYLNWRNENYKTTVKLLEKIDDPVNLTSSAFGFYIEALSDSSLQLNYSDGKDTASLCSQLVERKIRSLGLLSKVPFYTFSSKVRINIDDFTSREEAYIKSIKLRLANILFSHANANGDSVIVQKVLQYGSEGFDKFYDMNEDIVNDYLFYFNEYLRLHNLYEMSNYDITQRIFDNLIIEGFEHRDQIIKVKTLRNIFIDQHNLDWEKTELIIPSPIDAIGFINLNRHMDPTEVVSQNTDLLNSISISNVENDLAEVQFVIRPGYYTSTYEYYTNIELHNENGGILGNNVFPCLFE